MNVHSECNASRQTRQASSLPLARRRVRVLACRSMAAEIHLRDRVVLVTGASRGIGEAIAVACGAAGARVVLMARKQPDLDRVAATIRAAVVSVASVAGLRAAPLQGVYGMTKAAILSMTETLAFELGGSGVRVNAIAPGLVETRFASAIVQNQALRDRIVQRTPLGRHAQPDEIAGAAVYLLSH